MSQQLQEFADLALSASLPDVNTVTDAPDSAALVPSPAPGELESGQPADVQANELTFDGEVLTVDSILSETAANDLDLEQVPEFKGKQQLVKAVAKTRRQREVLKTEVEALTPLRALGDIETVKAKVDLADRLINTAMLDSLNRPLVENGRVKRDFSEFFEHVEQESGEEFLEELFNQLMWVKTANPNLGGQSESMARQFLRDGCKLDPDRIEEYQQLDSRLAQSGAVNPDDLANIEPKYHEAYRSLPAYDKLDWGSYDETRQSDLLLKAQREIDNAKYRSEQTQREERARQQALQAEQERIFNVSFEEVAQIREAKIRAITDQLNQLVFSADPKENIIQRDGCIAFGVMALEPLWRFSVADGLKAMNQTFDKTFNGVVDSIFTHTMNKHTYLSLGDKPAAKEAESKRDFAVTTAMAKIAPIVMNKAKVAGAIKLRQGEKLADAIERAQKDVIPKIPNGSPSTTSNLPGGPVTREMIAEFADIAIAGLGRGV